MLKYFYAVFIKFIINSASSIHSYIANIPRSMLENVLKGGSVFGGKKQAKSVSATGTNQSDFRLEYAKSGASKCGVCEEKIKKVKIMMGYSILCSESISV